MEVNDAAEILLKACHDDMNGRIIFSDFLENQTEGMDSYTSARVRGIYNKALLVLTDEGLCHRISGSDVVEIGQKGIAHKGDYRKHLKKRKTVQILDRARRIAPILSFVIVLVSFIITIMKKNSNTQKARAKAEMVKKDSLKHSKGRR
jgi:hypothetical protein